MEDFQKKVRKHYHVQYLDAGGKVQNIRLTSGLMKRGKGKWYNCQDLITNESYSINLKPKGKIWLAHDPKDPPANLPNLEDYYRSHHSSQKEAESVVDISHVSMAEDDNSSDEEDLENEDEAPPNLDFSVSLDHFKERFRTQGFISRKTVSELFTSAETLLDKAIFFVSKIGRGQYEQAPAWIEELTKDKEKIIRVFDEVLETLNEIRKSEQENLTNLDHVVRQVVEAKGYVIRGVDERIKNINLMTGDNLGEGDMEIMNIITESTNKSLPPSPDDDYLADSLSRTESLLKDLASRLKLAALLKEQAEAVRKEGDAKSQEQLIEDIQKTHKEEIQVMTAKLREELEEVFRNEAQKEKRNLEENLKQQQRENADFLKKQLDSQRKEAQREKGELLKEHDEQMKLVMKKHDQEIKLIVKKHDEEMNLVIRKHDEELDVVKQEHKLLVTNIIETGEELKKDFNLREEKLIADHESYQVNLREELERRFEDYKADYQATLGSTSVAQQAVEIQSQKITIQDCEKTINKLEVKARMLSDQYKEADKRARKLETELAQLRIPDVKKDNSVEVLENELKGVKLSLCSKTRELDSMSHELASSKASKESMSQACRKTERMITQLKADLERAAQAEEVAQNQVIMLRRQLSSISQEKDSLFLVSKDVEEENVNLKSMIRELERKLRLKEREFSQAKEYSSAQKEDLLTETTKKSTKTREETEDTQNNISKSIMEFNSDDDFTSDDLFDVRHLCRSREDDQIARLLRKVKRQIDEDERISQMIYNLSSIKNQELIKLHKTCHQEGEDSLKGIREKLLEELDKKFNTVSPRLKPLLSFGYKTLMAYDEDLFSAHVKVANEARSRNVNVDKPNNQKEKFLSPPKFSGEVSADSYHYHEFCKYLNDYINSIEMDSETAPAMVRETLTGRAKAMVDREFGDKIVPPLRELKSFLEKKFGEEQTILDQIIKAHEALGKIEDASISTMTARAYKHIDLYNKALFLEQKIPNIVFGSQNYKNCLRTSIFSRSYMNTIRVTLDHTNKEEIQLLRSELDVVIKRLESAENTSHLDSEEEKSTINSNPSDKGEERVSKYNKKSSYNATLQEPINQQEPVVDVW